MKKLIVLVIVMLAGTAAGQPGAPNSTAREACTQAMNADPEFAKQIVMTFDKKADQRVIEMHQAAAAQIAENRQHVIYAYAAMWILAALFVTFLWRRQQALKGEIAQLRRDLDAAAKEGSA
jgi:hypothetical protein